MTEWNYLERPMVYLAGPYTKPDPLKNSKRAIRIADELYEKYQAVVIVPHLSHWWEAEAPHPYQHWLAYDIVLLSKCDALYRFSGESSGADEEVEFARSHRIPVFYDTDEEAFARFVSAWDELTDRVVVS